MAFQVPGLTIPSLTAAADLSAKQFFFVEISADRAVNLAGDGEDVLGVLQNKPTSGQSAQVNGVGSITKVVAGAAIVAGANVSPDAAGKGKTTVSGNYIAGTALEAAGADGDVITVVLSQHGRLA